ncbi:sulfurtransferase [Patulibacter defluvii]|uniref:sulfurtransferase n=1 Tax=Patulibacter defluvii TaxID=3095358 RepID=UPI002A74E356|nr:rhodanese-like domain-containing protein [Patulibacter sp. DM4]
MPRLPLLVDPVALHEQREDDRLRIFDATVTLDRPAGGGPYAIRDERAAYEREHLPGAAYVDIPRELSDPDGRYPFAWPSAERFAAAAGALGIGEGTHVVVYSAGAPMWATRLWFLLRGFGFDDVSVLDGGLAAWRAAGLPLEAGTVTHPPATFVPRPRPELLADRADVEAIAGGDGATCLLNALPPAAFHGTAPSSYSRPGRIPRSTSLPVAELLDPESGRFRPTAELEQRLRAAGALGQQPVVAYCGGGISATVDLFALALVGRDDARLYDGSLTEWSADPALPLEVDPA